MTDDHGPRTPLEQNIEALVPYAPSVCRSSTALRLSWKTSQARPHLPVQVCQSTDPTLTFNTVSGFLHLLGTQQSL